MMLPHEPGSLPQLVYREDLSRREREVAALISLGMANKEIAHALGISVYTVKNHVANIFDKLGARRRVEVAVYAHENGLCGPTK